MAAACTPSKPQVLQGLGICYYSLHTKTRGQDDSVAMKTEKMFELVCMKRASAEGGLLASFFPPYDEAMAKDTLDGDAALWVGDDGNALKLSDYFEEVGVGRRVHKLVNDFGKDHDLDYLHACRLYARVHEGKKGPELEDGRLKADMLQIYRDERIWVLCILRRAMSIALGSSDEEESGVGLGQIRADAKRCVGVDDAETLVKRALVDEQKIATELSQQFMDKGKAEQSRLERLHLFGILAAWCRYSPQHDTGALATLKCPQCRQALGCACDIDGLPPDRGNIVHCLIEVQVLIRKNTAGNAAQKEDVANKSDALLRELGEKKFAGILYCGDRDAHDVSNFRWLVAFVVDWLLREFKEQFSTSERKTEYARLLAPHYDCDATFCDALWSEGPPQFGHFADIRKVLIEPILTSLFTSKDQLKDFAPLARFIGGPVSVRECRAAVVRLPRRLESLHLLHPQKNEADNALKRVLFILGALARFDFDNAEADVDDGWEDQHFDDLFDDFDQLGRRLLDFVAQPPPPATDEQLHRKFVAHCLRVLALLARQEQKTGSRVILDSILRKVPDQKHKAKMCWQQHGADHKELGFFGAVGRYRRQEVDDKGGHCDVADAAVQLFGTLLATLQSSSLCPALSAVFDQIDTSCDGMISLEELDEGMRGLGFQLQPRPLQTLFSALDFHEGGDGRISKEEFARYFQDGGSAVIDSGLPAMVQSVQDSLQSQPLLRQGMLQCMAVEFAKEVFVSSRCFDVQLIEASDLARKAAHFLRCVVAFPEEHLVAAAAGLKPAYTQVLDLFSAADASVLEAAHCIVSTRAPAMHLVEGARRPEMLCVSRGKAAHEVLRLLEALFLVPSKGGNLESATRMATRELFVTDFTLSLDGGAQCIASAVADEIKANDELKGEFHIIRNTVERAIVAARILTLLAHSMHATVHGGGSMMAYLGGNGSIEALSRSIPDWFSMFPDTDPDPEGAELHLALLDLATCTLDCQPLLALLLLTGPEPRPAPAEPNGLYRVRELLEARQPEVQRAAFRLVHALWEGAAQDPPRQAHRTAVLELRDIPKFWESLCKPLPHQIDPATDKFDQFPLWMDGSKRTLKQEDGAVTEHCNKLAVRAHCLHIIVLERHHGMHSAFRCLRVNETGTVMDSTAAPVRYIVEGPRGDTSSYEEGELKLETGEAQPKDSSQNKLSNGQKVRLAEIDRDNLRRLMPTKLKEILGAAEESKRSDAQWYIENWAKPHVQFSFDVGGEREAFRDILCHFGGSPTLRIVEIRRHEKTYGPNFEFNVDLLDSRFARGGSKAGEFLANARRVNTMASLEHAELFLLRAWKTYLEVICLPHVNLREEEAVSPHLSPLMGPMAKKKARKKTHTTGGHVALGVYTAKTSFLVAWRTIRAALEAHTAGTSGAADAQRFWRTGAAKALRHKCELLVALLHHQLHDVQLRAEDPSRPGQIKLKQCWRLLSLINELLLKLFETDASQQHLSLAVDQTALSTREALLTATLLLLQRAKSLISAVPAGRRERVREAKARLRFAVMGGDALKLKTVQLRVGEMINNLEDFNDCVVFSGEDAAAGRICRGDKLVAVDGRDVRGKTKAEVVKGLRDFVCWSFLREVQGDHVDEDDERDGGDDDDDGSEHQLRLGSLVSIACNCLRAHEIMYPVYPSPRADPSSDASLDSAVPSARLRRQIFLASVSCITTIISMLVPDDRREFRPHVLEQRYRVCIDVLKTERVLPTVAAALDAVGDGADPAYRACRASLLDAASVPLDAMADTEATDTLNVPCKPLCEQIIADGAARMEVLLLLLTQVATFARGVKELVQEGILQAISRNRAFLSTVDIAPHRAGARMRHGSGIEPPQRGEWWGYATDGERCEIHRCWCMVPDLARVMLRSVYSECVMSPTAPDARLITTMDTQLAAILVPFQQLVLNALQLRTLTMAGLDETEAVTKLLSSLCTWWQNRLATFVFRDYKVLFDAARDLTRDLIWLLCSGHTDSDSFSAYTEEHQKNHVPSQKHLQRLKQHSKAISVDELSAENRTWHQRIRKKILVWIQSQEDFLAEKSDGFKKKQLARQLKSRRTKVVLRREDLDTRMPFVFLGMLKRRVGAVLQHTVKISRKLAPRIPASGLVDKQETELLLLELNDPRRCSSDRLPLSVGHFVLCIKYCLHELLHQPAQQLCLLDASGGRNSFRPVDFDARAEWVDKQRVLHSLLFNAVHVAATNMHLHDMLYQYEMSQTLVQFKKDLERLASLAGQWQQEIVLSARCSHFIHHLVANPLAPLRWTSVGAKAAPFVGLYSDFLKKQKGLPPRGSKAAGKKWADLYRDFAQVEDAEGADAENSLKDEDKRAATTTRNPLAVAALNLKEVERALIRRDEVAFKIVAAVQGLQHKIPHS
jgi:hypothetical protein